MKWIIIAFFALYLVGYTLIHNTPLGLVLLFILLLAVGGLVLYYKYRLKDRFRVVGTMEEELKKQTPSTVTPSSATWPVSCPPWDLPISPSPKGAVTTAWT